MTHYDIYVHYVSPSGRHYKVFFGDVPAADWKDAKTKALDLFWANRTTQQNAKWPPTQIKVRGVQSARQPRAPEAAVVEAVPIAADPSNALGKITKVVFGFGGGGDDSALGATIDLAFEGVNTFMFIGVEELPLVMQQAKVTDVMRLQGVPIAVVREGGVLKKWRILTEVL